MEIKAHSQLELFSQVKGTGATQAGSGNSFFTFIRSYEKIVFILIGFIITGAVAFCIGVEKGKSLDSVVSAPLPRQQAVEQKTIPIAPVQTKTEIPAAVQAAPVQIATPAKPKETALQGYIIQIATYQNKTSAQKEAEILKRKGFSSSVLAKSGYNIVCVGNFSNKEQAKSTLTELKKQYRDCFIRRL
ncbi:MAG: SPOR domain-containing protein [Candidatus Omnitrophica bacterium]|nr:SPOR domain-containing protein [Candidatus Omnitrophota bacterium]